MPMSKVRPRKEKGPIQAGRERWGIKACDVKTVLSLRTRAVMVVSPYLSHTKRF